MGLAGARGHGRRRVDGTGHLTLHDGGWAYCAAGKPMEKHTWQAISPVPLASLKHNEPPLDKRE